MVVTVSAPPQLDKAAVLPGTQGHHERCALPLGGSSAALHDLQALTRRVRIRRQAAALGAEV